MRLHARANHGGRRGLLAFALASLIAFALALTTGAGPASAAVGPNQITHVYMNLANQGSQSQQNQYQGLIDSLRQASSQFTGSYRGNTRITQYSDQGLIRLSLHVTASNTETSLWIDPSDLYVLGFSNQWNQTWQFNDNRINLGTRLAQSGFTTNGNVQTLFFGGAYTSLPASAGVNRSNFQHDYSDIIGAVEQLAHVTNPTGGQANGSDQQWTARSLLLLIQATSEAARFYDINGVFRTTMLGAYGSRGLTAYQQNLENAWSAASAFGYNLTNYGSATPITTTGGISWNQWSDVASRIAIMLYRITAVPDQGNSGDWSHDEL
ncbi:ribosome-inactivating family protein [Streptomyces sp. NPDC001544]|uniref:ribosome-inactivating family protein n=1 Tax=Streptomyces sp. NPDC001544 TaxID=3364584 RepID=UPI00368C5CC1